MRICVDATSLLLRSAGVKNYAYPWMSSLREELPPDTLTAFPLLGEVGELNHEQSVYSKWHTLGRLALLHLSNVRGNPLVDYLVGDVDVFHASSLLRNLPKRTKLTGTIYDMTALIMPEVHTEGNIKAEKRFHSNVVRRADGLIAISESAKSDAVRMLRLDPRLITVIYPGIDQRFFTAQPLRRAKPYLLFVGTIEPRKNVDTLLDAWLEMPMEVRQAYDLVLAGPKGWSAERTVDRLTSGIVGVDYLGYVPETQLPGLTAGALGFVYPSLYEGFGFPLAQAMAAGIPCITSNISALPEVAGDAALLVDPKNSFALRDAMWQLVDSADLRDELGRKARMQASQFTWKNSAQLSAEFFRRVCGS